MIDRYGDVFTAAHNLVINDANGSESQIFLFDSQSYTVINKQYQTQSWDWPNYLGNDIWNM